METTRHFVATVYVVEGGATLLHEHDGLEMWLPPGGHVDRDELPHRAALREAHEETGLNVDLVGPPGDRASPTARELPPPRTLLLEDIDVCDGAVAHQHVDFVYYGRADHRRLDPGPGEQPADDWEWFDRDNLAAASDRLPADVAENGRRAIDAADGDG
jgi:8-oxo-dGTP pyrophosphatase MutT (NUDIX family)